MPSDTGPSGGNLRVDCDICHFYEGEAQNVPGSPSLQSPASYSSQDIHSNHELSCTNGTALAGNSIIKWKSDPTNICEDTEHVIEARNVSTSPPRSGTSLPPPPRHDSSYYSVNGTDEERSVLNAEVQTTQLRARERVAILRARAYRTRRIMRDWREKLRELREASRDAAAQLMSKIDELIAVNNVHSLKTLAPYHELARRGQDELGPAEEKYNQLESRLNDEEEELEQEEDHFYRHYNAFAAPIGDSKLDEELSPRVKPYLPPDSIGGLQLEPELVQEYHGKVLEAELIKEELEVLENDHIRYAEEATFRQRHDVPLSRQNAMFLSEFPELYKETVRKLREIENEVFDLRDKCIEHGLFSETDHIYESHDAFADGLQDAVDDALDRDTLLASHFESHGAEIRLQDFRDKREYVSNWLLGWTRSSSVESLQLRAWIYFEYPGSDKHAIAEHWSDLALEMWDADGAGAGADSGHQTSEMDAIYGGTSCPAITRSFSSTSLPRAKNLTVDFEDDVPARSRMKGSEHPLHNTTKKWAIVSNFDKANSV